MQEHQQRVVDEKRELDERIRKLREFLSSGKPDELNVPPDEVSRLRRQAGFMSNYSQVLRERIDNFVDA